MRNESRQRSECWQSTRTRAAALLESSSCNCDQRAASPDMSLAWQTRQQHLCLEQSGGEITFHCSPAKTTKRRQTGIVAGRPLVSFLGKHHFFCRLSKTARSDATGPGFCWLLWLINIHKVERFNVAEAQSKEQRQEWKQKEKNRQKLMGIFSFLEKGLSSEVLLLR